MPAGEDTYPPTPTRAPSWSPSNPPVTDGASNLPLTPRSRSRRRDQVAREILDSEKSFVEQMMVLTKTFIKPLRYWNAEIAGNAESTHPPLPNSFLQEIFSNIEQLLIFNGHVVEQFSELQCGSQAFGGFFKKAAPFFKMYSSYVSNYDRAMETLLHLIETRLDFAAFVRACELQEGCKGLNLRAYLIMPIQRIPRYKLLLTELLKHTPEEHPDFEDLEAAVKLVSGVVGAINEDIKRQEKRFKVIEIQERWDTNLVTASRKFEKEGMLVKVCRKGPKARQFVLLNDLLIYGARKIASSEKCTLHRKVDLSELFVVDSGNAEKTFILATRAKSFVVQCADMSDKKTWMAAFAACFAEMEKTVLYGKGRVLNKDQRLTHVGLWMVRDGEMVRESYLLPPQLQENKMYGFLDFRDLRLVVDPQGPSRGSMGKRVLSRIMRRGASLSQFNFKVQSEHPVPCEHITPDEVYEPGESDEDDESTFADALSPFSSASVSPQNLGLSDARTSYGLDAYSATRSRSVDAVPSAPLNDIGFQTTSGFIDGRQSGKWSGILHGLRPKGASSASPGPVADYQQRSDMAALERTMGLMGLQAPYNQGNGNETGESRPSPPPLSAVVAAPVGAKSVDVGRNVTLGGGVCLTKPTSPSHGPLSPSLSPRCAYEDLIRPAQEAVNLPFLPSSASSFAPYPSTSVSSLRQSSDSGGEHSAKTLAEGEAVSVSSQSFLGGSTGGKNRFGGNTSTSEEARKCDAVPQSFRHHQVGGDRPVKAPRSPRQGSLSPPSFPARFESAKSSDAFSRSSPPVPKFAALPLPSCSASSSNRTPGNEYVVVLPVSDLGLGIFLRDESGEVVVGGFRSPKHLTGAGSGASGGGPGGNGTSATLTNPSMRAGIKLGDVLLKVNGTSIHSVNQTISILRESRMEKVFALTLRRVNNAEGWVARGNNMAAGLGSMRVLSYSPPKPQSKSLRGSRTSGSK